MAHEAELGRESRRGNARRLEQHAFPWVGSLGVSGIKRAQIKEVLQRIEKTGHSVPFRAADLLRSEAEIAAYIDEMLADGDECVLPIALRTVHDAVLQFQRSRRP